MDVAPRPNAVEQIISGSLRMLWWVGAVVLVLTTLTEATLSSGAAQFWFFVVSRLALVGAYVLAAKRPSLGLALVCAVGVVGVVGAPEGAVATVWAAMAFTAGVAANRAPVAHLPRLALGVAVASIVVAGALLGAAAIPGLIFQTVVMAVAVGIGGWRRVLRRRRHTALENARLSERAEIARELHDVVAHHVTAIVVQAQAGQFTPDPAAAKATLAAIEAEGAAAMTAMRRMVATLRGAELPTVSTDLAAELDDLATTLRAAGVAVEEVVGDVPSALAPTIVRLTREAFTNVRKHAVGATRVRLAVHVRADAVHWSVIDDGRGTATSPGTGFGLVGLRERVEALGGLFTAGPHPDGWEVRAELPRGVPA